MRGPKLESRLNFNLKEVLTAWNLFQVLDWLHPRIQTLMLGREFCRMQGSSRRLKGAQL